MTWEQDVEHCVKRFTSDKQRYEHCRIVVNELSSTTLSFVIYLNANKRLRFTSPQLMAHGILEDCEIGVEVHYRCGDEVRVHAFQSNTSHDNNERDFLLLSSWIELNVKAMFTSTTSEIFERIESVDLNEYNPFGELMDVIEDSIIRSHKVCIVSGKPVLPAYRPRIRNCVSSYRAAVESGFGSKLLEWYIFREPHVLEYLVRCLTEDKDGFYYGRRYYPGMHTEFLGIDTHEEQLIDSQDLITSIPPLNDLINWSKQGQLKEKLDEINEFMYLYLQWLVLINRVYLHPQIIFKDHSNENYTQYVYLSASKRDQLRFAELINYENSKYTQGPCNRMIYPYSKFFPTICRPTTTQNTMKASMSEIDRDDISVVQASDKSMIMDCLITDLTGDFYAFEHCVYADFSTMLMPRYLLTGPYTTVDTLKTIPVLSEFNIADYYY